MTYRDEDLGAKLHALEERVRQLEATRTLEATLEQVLDEADRTDIAFHRMRMEQVQDLTLRDYHRTRLGEIVVKIKKRKRR